MRRSDLPFGSEFSPSQISLPRVLELAAERGGNWKAFEAAVRAEYFEDHDASDYNKGKLANNTKLGMIAYRIIDRDAALTDFGERLRAIREDGSALYAELAKHILLNLHGITFVQCIQDMQASGENVTLVRLRRWLGERGIHFPRGGKHPSIMRLWLEEAGVFRDKWRVDEGVVQALIGLDNEGIDALSMLTPQQKAFLTCPLSRAGGRRSRRVVTGEPPGTPLSHN